MELVRISHHGASETAQVLVDARGKPRCAKRIASSLRELAKRTPTERTGGDLVRSPRSATELDAADAGNCAVAAVAW